MADPRPTAPVLLVVAAFSRHEDLLSLARERLEASFGPVARASPLFDFDQTAYYEPTMGRGLRKRLFAFHDLVKIDALPELKLLTNGLERELAVGRPEPRPLNLDPGLLTLAKFLLASTKDQAHRVYLRDGVYAEATLRFLDGSFIPWPWTYADYRLPVVVNFLNEARSYYRDRLRRIAGPGEADENDSDDLPRFLPRRHGGP